MRRFPAVHAFALLALLGSMAAAAPGAQAEEERQDPKQQEAGAEPADAKAAEPADAKAAGSQRRPAGARSVWWNEPSFVETLSLTDEQRSRADAHLATYRKTLEAHKTDSLETFHQTLAKGDWAQAKRDLDEAIAQAALPVRARGELKLAVLGLLTDEQRATLVERYPRLIGHPWVRQGRRAPTRRQPR